jgi:hypothetical protein
MVNQNGVIHAGIPYHYTETELTDLQRMREENTFTWKVTLKQPNLFLLCFCSPQSSLSLNQPLFGSLGYSFYYMKQGFAWFWDGKQKTIKSLNKFVVILSFDTIKFH